ncbi:glycosyltransferase family 4 protein [Rossellomorea vietnamensis]|uniref:Glycosyltransferase family 4 protein n=1 Tax=Rossellomorea vietnamensis TaxID=218284 RepID=A0A5D4M7C2_9BACI|nr:glycosyltransferase family 4 protein [Rossellomorea vietnamensis]TYR97804.1 glycosyltransferase family 4 protein [Rossellomorea vietnamensis]
MTNGRKRLSITFAILTLCKGGAQRMLADITNELTRRGHDITILMPKHGEVEYGVVSKIKRGKHDRVLTEEDYPYSDIIVSNFYTTVNSAVTASLKGKGAHVRFSLCYEPIFFPDQASSFHSYHQAPNLLVLSSHQQNLISLLHGIKGEIVPIYVNPVFEDKHIRQNNKNLHISAIMRRTEGGAAWQRDQDYLMSELLKVKSLYPQHQYNIISPPNEVTASPSLQKIKNEKKFHLIAPANDEVLSQAYSLSDIFVTSSVFESAQMPGLEAMKCGAALAAVYAGGNVDYCRNGHNSLLSYRHENKLASDIIKLIENPNLRKKLAAQGKQDASEWTLERSASCFEEACYDLLSKR